MSLRLAPGEFVLLTGPSGCGKSTLLNVIGTLDRPDSGAVEVDGVEVSRLERPAAFRRRGVGFVFQLHNLMPILTARANVEVPMIAEGVPRRERRRRALELLDEVGLADRADHVPSELSGGQRQSVAVARALANRPRLLLADEPTGALDSAGGDLVLGLLERTRAERGTTILMVSHDPSAGSHTDRTLTMVDGRIVSSEGTTRAPAPRPAPAG